MYLSQFFTPLCTGIACYLVSNWRWLDFGLQENVWLDLWISTSDLPVFEAFGFFAPWSGKMDGQGQAFLGCSPVYLQKLYLMSFLTEHCSTVIIQGLYCCLWAPAPQLPVPWKRRSAHLWSQWVVEAIRWVAEPVEKNALQICCLHNSNSRRVTRRLQQKAGMGKRTLLTIQKKNSPLQKISMHYL